MQSKCQICKWAAHYKKTLIDGLDVVVVCWSLTSLCHSNGHIETMPAEKLIPLLP